MDPRLLEGCRSTIEQTQQRLQSSELTGFAQHLAELEAQCTGLDPGADAELSGLRRQMQTLIRSFLGAAQQKANGCDPQGALSEAEKIRELDPANPWLVENLAGLRASAVADERARERLKQAQAAIERGDVAAAMGQLERALGLAGLPACMIDRIRPLLLELRNRQRFVELSRQVEQATQQCNYGEAQRLLNEVASLITRSQLISEWLKPATGRLTDLRDRFQRALSHIGTVESLLSQAEEMAGAASQNGRPWTRRMDQAERLLKEAATVAPECLLRQEETRLAALRTRIANLRSRRPMANACSTDDLEAALRERIPSLPFFAQSEAAKATGSFRFPETMGYGVMDAPGAVGFSDPARIQFSANWDVKCRAPGAVNDIAAKCKADTGAFGEDSCLSSFGKPGAKNLAFTVDPYLGGTTLSVRNGSLELSVGTLISIWAGAEHGARTKPGVVRAVRKASEDWAKVIATRLMGSNAIPKGVSGPTLVSMLPGAMMQADVGPTEGHFQQAKASLERRNLNGAAAQLEKANALAPDSPAVHYNLSWVYQAQDQLSSALEHARGYLQHSPAAADRVEVQERIATMEDELRRNPRVAFDPDQCRGISSWARKAQRAAKKSKSRARRQSIMKILIAAQGGDCQEAEKLAATYKQSYGSP